MLSSAIARPRQTVFGEDAYSTMWKKAAALYASISQNHAFHNGNKRTAFASMTQFLWLNGYQFHAGQKEAEDYTVSLVTEKPGIKGISSWIEKHTSPR